MHDPHINTGSIVVCRNAKKAVGIKKGKKYRVIRQNFYGDFSFLELEGLPGRYFMRRFDVLYNHNYRGH